MNALSQSLRATDKASDPDWWRGAVIYQIYPRSYQDSTGSGTGDLAGITRRLDHVASLGVDGIWISPFFTSPMKDFGYDVSDYCDVDPMFGTLADFDALIARAHELGLKVMIDLVLSHSSDQHPWFVESRVSKDNPKSDWYVWSDPKPDGTAPNNWLSIFGGPAWHWDGRREQYYLHNFLSSQPDLNFHNSDVQDALLDATRFWLQRGVDGFRLDTINFYFADRELRDNPALSVEERNSTIAPSVNPYNHQRHLHSKNQPENLDFLARFRSVLDEYPGAAAVGEVGDAQFGLELLGEYTKGTTGAHMCYAFEFLEKNPLTAKRVAEVFERFDRVASDGWACWALSNHDVIRHTTRWDLSADAQKAYLLLLLLLRGSVCLYQGEELALPEADVAFEDLQDPYGIEFWPEFKGRDGCRTPMVWEPSNAAGGFSEAKPWLPVASEHLTQSVAAQEGDPSAMLHFYRTALAFRAENSVLNKGDQSSVNAEGDVVMFARFQGNTRLTCCINLSDSAQEIALPGQFEDIGGAVSDAAHNDGILKLNPWGVAILRHAT